MATFDPTVFLSSEGCVAVLSGNAQNAGFSISVSDLSADSAYDNLKSIVTSVTMNDSANVQFTPTLDKSIFMYVFGDQVSSLDVSGVCFLAPQKNGVSGVVAMKEFYRANRVSKTGSYVGVSRVIVQCVSHGWNVLSKRSAKHAWKLFT